MERIAYQVIRSARKTIAIQISADGNVVVRAPRQMGAAAIEAFVQSKTGWIEQHLAKRRAVPVMPKLTNAEIHSLAQQAKTIIPVRVAYYAKLIGVSYGDITIRNQRTRWGSCSSKGILNFRWLLMLTKPEVIDYVVVHELCHRKEMNHSSKFWAEVERILPNYRESRRWLKENGQSLIGRLQ